MSGIRRQFKVCLIGDGFVGKSSIRRTYLKEGFKRSYLPTLGVDFAQKSIIFNGVPTNLVIWDIAGQTAYKGLRRRYYEGASGIILVYSVVDRSSFDSASKWLVEAHGFMQNLPPMIIAANKIDLSPTHPKEETVSPEEGRAFAKRFSEKLNTPVVFIETSALKGINIDEVFTELTRMMVGDIEPKHHDLEQETPTHLPESTTTQEAATPSPATTRMEIPSKVNSTTSSKVSDATISNSESITIGIEPKIDPVTSLAKDSVYLQEEYIAQEMAKLVDLRAELKTAEEELANVISELETKLLNLRNVVHVKKIMYEYLKQQLSLTRQEWANAYDEYTKTNQRRKDELVKRSRQIEEIRKQIENIGKIIRTRVSDLDIKRITE